MQSRPMTELLTYQVESHHPKTHHNNTTIFSQETINWEVRKDELVTRKTEQLAIYAPNGDRLSKE